MFAKVNVNVHALARSQKFYAPTNFASAGEKQNAEQRHKQPIGEVMVLRSDSAYTEVKVIFSSFLFQSSFNNCWFGKI